MKTMLMFAGQGSQYFGMGIDLLEKYPHLISFVDEASNIISKDVLSMFHSQESFTHTFDTQIMMVVTQAMMLSILRDQGISYDAVMGFSLGEMTASYAAGIYQYHDLIKLTAARAEAMQKACDDIEGMMAAVIKLDSQVITEICKANSSEDAFMVPVNFNSPMQTVISGHKLAFENIATHLKQLGGRVIPLKVAGAFHTPLMRTYQHMYEKALNDTKFSIPHTTFLSNVTGDVLTQDFAKMMLKQMTSPVLFTTMIKHLKVSNFDQVIEIGPGNVLSGLVSKQIEDIHIITINNANALEVFQ